MLTVVDTWLDLAAGQEWHSDQFFLGAPATFRLTVQGPLRIYAGLFSSDEHARLRQQSPFRFPFLIGSARFNPSGDYTITGGGYFNVVIRASLLNVPGRVHVLGGYL